VFIASVSLTSFVSSWKFRIQFLFFFFSFP